MSRATLNSVLKRSIAAGSAMPVQFLRFAFGGGDVRVTTAPFDVDWDGFTWQGIGGQLDFDALRESPDDRGAAPQLRLSGVDQSLVSEILSEQYIGRAVEIWFGWIAVNTNLIGNSGFETNTTGYSVTGATLTRSQAVAPFEGDYVGACAITTSAADQGLTTVNNLGSDIAVVPGVEYVFRLRHRLADGSSPRVWRAYFDFYTSAPAYISSSSAVNFTPQPSGWGSVEVPAIKAPATAAYARCRCICNAATGLYTVYFDAFHFGPAGSPLYQPTDGAQITGGTVLADPLRLGSYLMNGGFSIEETPSEREGSTVDISGTVVSTLATMLQPQGFRTNLESHQAEYPGDTFFAFTGFLGGKVVTWGGKPTGVPLWAAAPPFGGGQRGSLGAFFGNRG